MKKAVRNTIIACCIITTVILISDFFNLPSRLGIDTTTINWDIVSIVVGNIVVIGLYLITYHVLDKRSVAKETNQRKTAEFMLVSTYDSCCEKVRLFSDAFVAEKAAQKCDFNKLDFQDDVMQRYFNLPFDHHEAIGEFAKEGVITSQEYEAYLKIRKLYRDHMGMRITFFDAPQFSKFCLPELMTAIDEAKRGLNEKQEAKRSKKTQRKVGRLKRNR